MLYPLANVHITMEDHHFLMGKLTLSMAIFNSYVSHYQRVKKMICGTSILGTYICSNSQKTCEKQYPSEIWINDNNITVTSVE